MDLHADFSPTTPLPAGPGRPFTGTNRANPFTGTADPYGSTNIR